LRQGPGRHDAGTAGPVSGKLTGDVKGLKIGLADEFFEGLPDDIRSRSTRPPRRIRSSARRSCRSASHAEVRPPAYYILACAEASSNLGATHGLRYGHRAGDFF
jgi:aspartyl-tRNA(Asn)/glutamyl-tRNA(Gln) amidotransferase subunit A